MVFLAGLCHFLYVHDDINVRGAIISATLATMAFLSAQALLTSRTRPSAASANFPAAVFIAHGSHFAVRLAVQVWATPTATFFDPTLFNWTALVDAIVVGLLWTFGRILMINQRLVMEAKDAGEEIELMFNTSPDAVLISRLSDGLIVSVNDTVVRDVTERKRAEAEREKLQAQLSQSQRLESVGRLAGGIAHEFNNTLMGITNHVELCRDRTDSAHPIREWLDEITEDTSRSAGLTRQLLGFARKQLIAPKRVDLNQAAERTILLLQSVIGANVELRWAPAAALWSVELDASQVEQLLTALCTNARDAIAGAGRIVVQTASVTVAPTDCAGHPDAGPGKYVLLTVSDDGCGMDKATLNNLFEPFFATKESGPDAGLGLSSVYGIVV